MGELVTVRVSTSMMRIHELPEGLRVAWSESDAEQVLYVEGIFYKYLKEGWMAYSDSETGKQLILRFDPKLARIVLIPPIGGG